ncbi:MAG: DUF4097 domain-containing protein [Candidatus Bathyarchaeota archaeon]|nr:DUF4097 domain-containing protein [Candidatus Bathyarchaeota archaeon]
MSDSGMGFGGFLLGLGGGWYILQNIDVTIDMFSWILIIIGAGMVINALLGGRRRSPVQGLFGGIVGGLVLAMFITQGFGFVNLFTDEFTDITDSQYRAEEIQTLTGDVDLDNLYLEVDNKNGAINVDTWDNSGYSIELTIKARGTTDAQAEKNLEDIEVVFSDTAMAGTQRLVLGFEVPGNEWTNYLVIIDVKIPDDLILDINLDTSNGAITLTDINVRNIEVDTSNGRITLDNIISETIVADTSNGLITGRLEGTDVNLETSNGAIEITIIGSQSGEYTLDTTNGAVTVDTPSSTEIGYDIDLKTTVGSVDVNLPNLSYSTDDVRRKIAKTSDYSMKDIQIRITAETSIGNVDVN